MSWRKYHRFIRASNFWLGSLVGFFLLPEVTLAGTEADLGPEFNGGQWIWSLFSLIFVVVLAFWATKFLAGRYGFSQGRHIKVAESLSLGPNRHLYLLLVNGKVFLVGSAEQGINILKEFDDGHFYEELVKSTGTEFNAPSGRFASMIIPVLNSMNSGETVDTGVSDPRQRLREGLAKIRSWKMRGHDHDDKV